MGAPIVSLTDIKTYLGKTGTDDDVLIASVASNATAMAERDTSRIFSVTSNVTTRYSTDGQTSLVIHDRPYNDATRTIVFAGATMTENTNVWMLPDRRDPDAVSTIQLRPYDRDSWARSFSAFDANLDRYPWIAGTPNDLVISGTVGHPATPGDVFAAVLELAAWLYWRAKGGASSMSVNLTGEEVDLSLLPMAYQEFVRNWRIHTAVAAV
jgi:hypothetical protein